MHIVSKYLVEEMGFKEGVNAKSVHLHKEKGIRISMHVDDPIIVFKKDAQGVKAKDRDWFEFFKKVQESLRFEVEETHQLKAGEPIDYCSIRIQLQENGDMTLDNSQCVDKILADAKHGRL